MRALGTVLPWWRAVLVAESGWELRRDSAEPRALAEDDVARTVARESAGPRVVDVGRDGWEREPSRVLHGLTGRAPGPDGGRGCTCTSTSAPRTVRPPDETGLVLLAEFRAPARRAPLDLLAPEDPGATTTCPDHRTVARPCARRCARWRAVAPSDLVVHVSGETGTGKERVAGALHDRSGRPGRFRRRERAPR
jgi:hypothetical protein